MTASIPIILSFFFCHIISITLSFFCLSFGNLFPRCLVNPFTCCLTISSPKTMLYFIPNDVAFTLRYYDVITLISARKLSFLLLFFVSKVKNT